MDEIKASVQTLDEDENVIKSTRYSAKTTNFYTRHPLELSMKLQQTNSAVLKLSWAYFDNLDVVGVTLSGEKNASLQDLPPSFVICDLFSKDDDGSIFPHQDRTIDGYYKKRLYIDIHLTIRGLESQNHICGLRDFAVCKIP
jgi:hypothetical protein